MLGRRPSGVLAVKTKAPTSAGAAEELARLLPVSGLAMVVVFLSPYYDPHRFTAAMASHFVGTPVFGCTTAGEIALDGWDENSVVALAFCATDFEVTAHPLLGLSDVDIEDGHSLGGDHRLLSLGTDGDDELLRTRAHRRYVPARGNRTVGHSRLAWSYPDCRRISWRRSTFRAQLGIFWRPRPLGCRSSPRRQNIVTVSYLLQRQLPAGHRENGSYEG